MNNFHHAAAISNNSQNFDTVSTCGVTCKTHSVSSSHSANLWNQVQNFGSNILNTKDWPARWYCGSWSDFHGWLYILSDLLIWASYFAIPILLLLMLRKRPDLPFPKIVLLFIAFIVLCGLTHLLDAIIFWWPAYRLSAVLRLVTGIVSAVTVYALYKIIPSVLSLRSFKELEHEIETRKRVEEQLAASEFLLSEAGRLGKVGGWEFDVKSQMVSWSKVVYDIHELPYDHKVTLEETFEYFTPPFKSIIRTHVKECITNGTSYDLELQIETVSGTIIWVRSRGEALYNEDGNISKLRGVLMDIDKYKINEMSLYKSIEMVTQNNMQLKGFTHILSHNIRNYAGNISLLTGLVDTSELRGENAKRFEKLCIVSTGLNKTLDYLNEAIKIKEVKVDSEELSVNEITEHVITIMQPEIAASDALIEFNFVEQTILFPKLYMESILMNLLSNAIKYKENSRRLQIGLRTYKNLEGNVLLECRDNGLGIDLSLHGQKIFGLYKTFHSHKNSNGVGLFLVKTQVESQGGTISVESALHEGTTFKIVFNRK